MATPAGSRRVREVRYWGKLQVSWENEGTPGGELARAVYLLGGVAFTVLGLYWWLGP